MNPSQPVSSQISNVSFGYLTADDVRQLSARRITSAVTFDTLANPIPGGLYSAELGQFMDNACATCGLKNPQCPGHPGHIELPVPCYHPTFFDQILRLLRGGCIYCGKLKMKRILVTRFVCKLRLVRHGLLKELKELEEKEIQAASDPTKAGAEVDQDDDESDNGDADTRALSLMLERYVNDAIKSARRSGTLSTAKSEAGNAERIRIIKDFMANMNKGKKCGNCGGINHSYRKDRFVKLFKKPLSEKDHAAMVQKGLKARDPLVEMRRKLRAERSRKRKRDEDEAVADLDRTSEEEVEEESEGEPTIIGGDLEDAMIIDGAAETATQAQKKPKAQDEYLNPSRVYAQLQQLFESDAEVLSLVYGQDRRKGLSADMFFLQTLLVPPNRFRPEARQGDGAISEALENGAYRSILQNCDTITEIQRELSGGKPAETRYRERTYADLESAWLVLQENVNTLIDKDRSPLQGAANARTPDGIKQKLEKKEGMFRKYMMGKRVNFAARTVISPDPNIETNEIGVPPVFAVKLTYPEPVTQWNYEELQAAVQNGPHIWPGAVAIESENGAVVSLERKNPEERLALANSLLAPSPSGNTRGARPKKVHRHLNNGDIVIMNRQPTLHKPSMMCHRARVLPGEKTLRMHYANCNTYNADFDGDEMNMHFPQNELARAEALSIADTDHQYLSGTAGNPLRGLIQDHISMCVWLTSRDMFFERGDYMNLLYAALRPESGHCSNGKVETVPPAIFKPKPLWTGKQVVSTVLKNLQPHGAQGLTMNGKSTTPATMWGKVGKDEGEVIVKDGDLLQGILDKKQIGPASGGFVNAVYEAYGHTIAGKLLSVLGRLLTKLLHMRAFSCGVEDLIFTRNGEESRQKALAGAQTVGLEVASKYVSLQDQKPTSEDKELKRRLEDVLREDAKLHGLDLLSNAATAQLSSQVSTDCMPAGLAKPFPKNQMQTMTNSGAKGSKVNVNLISCNLGQQVLEGRRVPVMVSGKTLPCFAPFDSSVRAGGYIVDRFLTGIRPQEYFFHAMAGREGLIDTAVKTSRSGYLQRCLIKGMEGLRVEYDTTVRNTEDGSVVQFLYGEDGLDVGKAKYMDDYKFTAENYLSLFNSMQMGEAFDRLLSQEAKDHNKAAEKKFRKTGDLGSSDPAIALYSPANHVGAISEKQFKQIRDYIEGNPHRLVRDKKQGVDGPSTLSKRNLEHILAVRYLKSVVESGEAVGVVAGQSVGEPSTQMTLNTFHLAGHAAKNVTLGIPRLREIVMTAAKDISTPQMTLLMNQGISAEDAKKFAKGISKLSLAEIVDKVTVSETVGKGIGYGEAKQYSVRLDLFPSEEYQREYAITVQDVVRTIENSLLPILQKTVRKELKKRGDAKTLKGVEAALGEVGKSQGTVEQERTHPQADREGGDDDSDGEGDDDATRDKTKSNKQQAGYEAFEDDEEQDIQRDLRRKDATPEPEDAPPEDEAYGGSEDGSPEPEYSSKSDRKNIAANRLDRIKGSDKTNDIASFDFDDKKGSYCTFTMEYDSTTAKILMLNLLETSLRNSLIQHVDNIEGCMLDEEALKDSAKKNPNITPTPTLLASGVNIKAMWSFQHAINPNHIYTNSIHSILELYGVEAARAAIVRELQGVFGGHGISVDPRHLMLIADYMTRNGGYQAFSRMGYGSNVSPFMKMSFETTVGFLKDAVLNGEVEDLKGPSARIVVGKVGGMGTGMCDVFMPVRERNVEEGDGDVEMED
ncbi:DNA-directed RNA polymerase I subunit rpa1 [Pseudocercospora fuligena]|uniref:DNA-directed RNA polymerase subunit n=1 Tax=Pseudocercospora fuligena TaxID=685502 RepID=A0A8H6VSQ5_9PEZI|nr:DNA-directed RNA polymerase I subunit rpa1 [Pseudocercospora fuligena]